MYYLAEVYVKSVVKDTIIANNIETLKIKAQLYIKDEKVTMITVSEIKDVGFFKVPKQLKKHIDPKEVL